MRVRLYQPNTVPHTFQQIIKGFGAITRPPYLPLLRQQLLNGADTLLIVGHVGRGIHEPAQQRLQPPQILWYLHFMQVAHVFQPQRKPSFAQIKPKDGGAGNQKLTFSKVDHEPKVGQRAQQLQGILPAATPVPQHATHVAVIYKGARSPHSTLCQHREHDVLKPSR